MSKTPATTLCFITKDGMSIRFNESDVRSNGPGAPPAMRGINLEKSDALVAAAIVVQMRRCSSQARTEISKRTPFDEYRVQSRGGKGHHHDEDEREDRRCDWRADRSRFR